MCIRDRETHLPAEVTPFADGAEIAAPYKPGFDIILLDVDMPQLGGMSAAERIREQDENVVLVFVTNMAQCAIRGYEVDALDFVVKPVSYAPFSMRLARAIKRVRSRAALTISLQTNDGLQIVTCLLYTSQLLQNFFDHLRFLPCVWSCKIRVKISFNSVRGTT